MENNSSSIPWIPVIELAVLAFTTLGTTITLFLHSDAKMEAFRKESLAIQKDVLEVRKEIARDNREFHERIYSLEERYRSK